MCGKLWEMFTSPAGAVAKYCDEYICLFVCVSARISPEPDARSLPNFLSVARSSSGMVTIGRITYRREGVTGVHSVGEV